MPRTRIKFCGFTRPEDIAEAISLKVDYLGLVFAPRSPRRVTLKHARSLRRPVPESIDVVALVMDQPAHEIQAIIDSVHPDILQFHGCEPDALCTTFGLPFWKAIAMGSNPAHGLEQMTDYPSASAFLFDGHAAGEPGGSGQCFDWSRLPAASKNQHILLAGGLGAHNVAAAIHTAAPWGVDLSSGIESEPGIKDAIKMRTFVKAVQHADQTMEI